MEQNQIRNREMTSWMADAAVNYLLENKYIKKKALPGLRLHLGYVFTTESGEIEALFSLIAGEQSYYFALQKNRLKLVGLNQAQYEQIISDMKNMHPCLRDEALPETELQKKRREENNDFLRKAGIAVSDTLPCQRRDEETALRSVESVARRAIACFLTVQLACDIGQGRYAQSIAVLNPLYDRYGVRDCLNAKERRIVEGSYSQQDAIDLDWAYEDFWALCWCLGLVEDIRDAGQLCDCRRAIDIMNNSPTWEAFLGQCALRPKQEILDMLDLFCRCHWAICEHRVNPAAPMGNLDPSVVIERRRALEWVFSMAADWYELQMNA